MVDVFIRPAAVPLLVSVPKYKVARLKLVLLDHDPVIVTVKRLICGTYPEVCAEFGIDLADRPTYETGAVELVITLCTEYIRGSELCERHPYHIAALSSGKLCEDLVDVGVAVDVYAHQPHIIGAVFRLHHFIKDLALIIVESEMIGRFLICQVICVHGILSSCIYHSITYSIFL